MRNTPHDPRLATITAAARALHLPTICSVDCLAAALGVTPPTVRRWLRHGLLSGRKLGRRWYMQRDALLDAVRPAPSHAPWPIRILPDTEDAT